MMQRQKYLAWVGATISLAVLAGCGASNGGQSGTSGGAETGGTNGNQASVQTTSQAPGQSTSGIQVGANAPNFSLPLMDGQGTVTLKQLVGQKPVIINAWASWCGPCQEEEPTLLAMAKQYQGKVTVIGVNMTSTDSITGAKKFVSDYHITYPVLMDPKSDFMNKYQLVGFPTTFLISAAGKIEAVHIGMLTQAQMKSLFDQAAS